MDSVVATDDDAEIGVVPIARPGSDAIDAPPFEEAFPFNTRVTPGESAEDGDSEGFERAKRYVYPKSFGSNKGVMTANGFIFEYEKLHDVPSPVGAHATEAMAAIQKLFGAGGDGSRACVLLRLPSTLPTAAGIRAHMRHAAARQPRLEACASSRPRPSCRAHSACFQPP